MIAILKKVARLLLIQQQNKETIQFRLIVLTYHTTTNLQMFTISKGATIQSPGGGRSFGRRQLLNGWLKISFYFIRPTCLYSTFLELNYIFHAESARNHLFQ